MSEEIITEIKEFFSNIETLIKNHFDDDNIQNQSDIQQEFKNGKRLIDKLKDDQKQHGSFRFQYHIIYASYLKTIGEVDDAQDQEVLSKKFEVFKNSPKKEDTYKKESMLLIEPTLENLDQSLEPENNIQGDVEKQLNKLRSLLREGPIEDIKQTFKVFNIIPRTFEDYKSIVTCNAIVCKLIDNLINEGLIGLEKLQDSTNTENKEQIIRALKPLKLFANKAAYEKRINFIQNVLNSSNKKGILFDNVFTEERINKQYKELALYFHPDKTNRPNSPNYLRYEHKNLSGEIFRDIQEIKESLLIDLEDTTKNENVLSSHETMANKLWSIAIDYRNASKAQWSKLKLLKKDDIKDISSERLIKLSEDNGRLAYERYRSACKVADRTKQLRKQVKLRSNMALCLYISNCCLEAQLYALSAINLIIRNSQDVTQQDLFDAKGVFDKVKGGGATKNNSTLNNDNNIEKALALTRKADHGISYSQKTATKQSINEDLEVICTELMIHAERSLGQPRAYGEKILHAEERSLQYKAKGGTAIVGGIGIGGSVAANAGLNIYAAIAIGAGVSNPLLLIGELAIGIATLGLGIWGGVTLWQEGVIILEEPTIRENLNKIMIKALKAFDEGDHQKFLDTLAEEFTTGICLLKLKDRSDIIDTKKMVYILVKHGFRSDGIAYLFNLIGEVLSSGKVKIEGKTKMELKELAKDVLLGALNKELEVYAKRLDDRICELRVNGIMAQFTNFFDISEFNGIANEASKHLEDAEEMPFKSRLDEMRNIAKINLAIIDMLAGSEEISRARTTVEEVRNSMNANYQFVGTVETRLEVLEDFLWVISGEELPDTNELPLITYTLEPVQDMDNNKYLCYLNEKLQNVSLDKDKKDLYIEIAACHEKLAEEEDKINQLRSLCNWQKAQKNYEKVREINSTDIAATLGFARCLLKLSKYKRVIELLKSTHLDLKLEYDYWCLCSIAYFKQNDYKKANECILEALRIIPQNKLAMRQKKLVERLRKENTLKNRIDHYQREKKAIKSEEDYLINSRNNSHVYRILSIDGGGIRGILPALWLSELEYRAHRPISHLFNMISGTSTGGIIAAGLSAPSWHELTESSGYKYSEFEPLFSASSLLDFYQNNAKNLFASNNSLMDYFKLNTTTKYNYRGRLSMFKKDFGHAHLDCALTQLVIPAARKEGNLTHSHLFTHFDALKDESRNDTFVNALMATTAAPYFFPPHNINDKGVFLDGGLHLNNPAMEAYNEAIRYNVAREKIFMLSMGTGSYIPDPFNPDLYHGQLFWEQNLHNAMPPTQEDNTNQQLYTILGNKYQRWQVWFEEPLKFDDINNIPTLLEIGNQHIEELDASDENPLNKLVESFEEYESNDSKMTTREKI
nr:14991_t:CDS:1 [Entrophospora candida]